MKKITESTLIPISLVISIVAGVAWISSFKSMAESNRDDIIRVEKKQDDYILFIRSVDERLSRMEGRLGIKKHHTEE